MTDPWAEKPRSSDACDHLSFSKVYDDKEMDAWLEKLKAHYEPYDELLKAEPLMPLDIKSVLAKEGMPILLNEKRFRELEDKAKKYEEIQAAVPLVHHLTFEQFVTEYTKLWDKLEFIKDLEFEPANIRQIIVEMPGLVKSLHDATQKVLEWEAVHMRDPNAASSILIDLEKLLIMPKEEASV